MMCSIICCRVMQNKHIMLFTTNFLWNVRTENYKELVEDMLMQYHKLGCNGPLCFSRSTSFIPIWIYFLTTVVWLVMNMANVFIKISQLWNRNTMENPLHSHPEVHLTKVHYKYLHP